MFVEMKVFFKKSSNHMKINEFDLLADLLHEVSSDLRRAKFATVFTFLFTGDFGLLRRFM